MTDTAATDTTITVRFAHDVETMTAAARERSPWRRGRVGRRIALVKLCVWWALGSVVLLTVTSGYLAWTEREMVWYVMLAWSAFLWWGLVKIWRSVRSPAAVRKALAERGLLDAPLVVTASPADGLRWESRLGIVEIPWAGVMSWRESKRMFLIADRDGLVRFAPKSAFSSQAEVDAFRRLLQKHAV